MNVQSEKYLCLCNLGTSEMLLMLFHMKRLTHQSLIHMCLFISLSKVFNKNDVKLIALNDMVRIRYEHDLNKCQSLRISSKLLNIKEQEPVDLQGTFKAL